MTVHKESGEVKQARYGVIVAVVFGGLGIAWTAAQAVTPGERLAKVEAIVPTVADHEKRIYSLEERDEMLDAIAKAVNAEIPKKHRRKH